MCLYTTAKVVVAAFIAWYTLLPMAACGDPLEECQKRDAWCSRRTFVWDVTINVSWHLSKAEAEKLRSDGVNVPMQRTIEGRLVVSRTPRLTYLGYTQARATLSSQTGMFEYWFGKDFIVVMPHEQNTPGMSPAALVLPAPGDALYLGTFLPPISDEFTFLLHPSFVAGVDPLRVFAPTIMFQWRKGRWSLREQQGQFAVFELQGVPDVSAQIHLDASKRFVPAFFSGRRGAFHLEYTVLGWQRVDGWWLPGSVKITQTASTNSSTAILTFQGVSETPLTMDIQIPRGTPVTDLRDIPPERIAKDGLLFVQGRTYHYSWTGRLPERGVLPAVGTATSQPFTMVRVPQRATYRDSFPLWQTLAAISLIAIGVLWYWRLKRVERHRAG